MFVCTDIQCPRQLRFFWFDSSLFGSPHFFLKKIAPLPLKFFFLDKIWRSHPPLKNGDSHYGHVSMIGSKDLFVTSDTSRSIHQTKIEGLNILFTIFCDFSSRPLKLDFFRILVEVLPFFFLCSKTGKLKRNFQWIRNLFSETCLFT